MLNSALKGDNQLLGYFLMVLVFGVGITLSAFQTEPGIVFVTGAKWLELLVIGIVVLSSALFLNSFLEGQKFIGLGNISPGFFLILFLSGLPNLAGSLPIVVSVLLIIFLIRRLILLHNTTNSFIPVFEIGVILGAIISITPQFSGIILLYLIGLTLVKSFGWRDFVVPLIGIGFVFMVRIVFRFFMDQDLNVSELFSVSFYRPGIKAGFNAQQILLTGITAIEFLFISKLFGVIEKKVIRIRIHYWLWVWMSLFLLFSMLFLQSPIDKVELILLMGLPVAVFSNELLESDLKPWMKELLIAGLMLMVIALKVLPLLGLTPSF